jgi:predicted O-methyltransferase YrrM
MDAAQPADPAAAEVFRHADSWVSLADLGCRRPYKPTFGTRPFVNEAHQRFATCPTTDGVTIDVGITGSLRREDALKLYEVAYHAAGDVLDLGTGRGLSASILGEAVLASGRRASVVSVERDRRRVERARENLAEWGLGRVVALVCDDAPEVCRRLTDEGRRFGVVFVDHSQTYRDVLAICELLPGLLVAGGFVLFHDFNDRRNRLDASSDYGVFQAVQDGLPIDSFSFYGAFGCTALYRFAGSAA